MSKIIITGGLGYIGTEICKLYSGDARYNDITVIDYRFVSERVKQLRDWGINFIQCDLFDDDVLSVLLSNADIVIHLAGITDVAYTKTDSNKDKDDEIKKIGVDGTRNILKYINNTCKLIFPSTHVVYEGFSETMIDITEDVPVTPILTYSTGKAQSEKDIINSGKNYIILRLGSIYGYSTDTMRINIMPNLFSKIASQNGVIKMFSKGVQLKSLSPLIDTARCFKYMSERDDINKEIYHVSKENMTVKDVAEICKSINPNLTLVETDDEIPNMGYTISNKKLLSTGFKFLYNIHDCIKEMIDKWSKKNHSNELEYVVNGGDEFIDERGKISNYELTEPINLIGYIESKSGAVRANHYHPIQEQKCLLIKGRYISVIKDLSNPTSIIETNIINAGDLSVIKPNVAHAMVFLEDSIFLNLVNGERDHENYGITHTIPYLLVDDKFKNDLLNGYKTECRGCGNNKLKKIISLGKSPMANNLLDNQFDDYEGFPLEVNYCDNCHNTQLNYIVPPKKMFDNYLYVSSTTESFRKHFLDASNKYIKKYKLDGNSFVIDIGSNDGISLKPLKERGITVLGIEPASNIAKIANKNGIKTWNEYFTNGTVNKLIRKADIITASNVFAHADNLVDITNNVFKVLKNKGTFIIEVQYIVDTINDLTFDNIYHEHVNYWSVTSLHNFFSNIGYKITDVEHIDTHGGSIRVYVQRSGVVSKNVYIYLKNEEIFGINNFL